MKKLFFFMLITLFFEKFYGQTERYIYRTEVNPDTINLVTMKVENTILDIKGNQSLFSSESKLLRDSLISVLRAQGIKEIKKSKKEKSEFPKLLNGKKIEPTFFDFFITKNKDEKSINFVKTMGSKQVYYVEDRKMDWTICDEFSEHHGIKVQKATLNFGGRNWTAWFSPEIKISDGPYKFFGLPGLILKLDDDRGDYKFIFTKKIIINNAFSELIKNDARKSTRINFLGDLASVRMELVKNKEPEFNFDSFNRMNQRNNSFGMEQNLDNELQTSEQMDSQTENIARKNNENNTNIMNLGITNPIELTNKH